jgi:hypothetical protein
LDPSSRLRKFVGVKPCVHSDTLMIVLSIKADNDPAGFNSIVYLEKVEIDTF